MQKKQDNIYASPLAEIVDFQFDEEVADVLPDMIRRSVPGYAMLIATIGILAETYVQPNSHCYDLGCSLGAVSMVMRERISDEGCDIIAVDNSPAMIERASSLFSARSSSNIPVRLVCADIQDVVIDNASVVVLNLTLQFIPLERRLTLIKKIYQGLNPGGILILAEKVSFAETDRQAFHTELHQSFKKSQGYSDLEISQKRTALENVMIPETVETHEKRLQDAGFDFVETWYQCLNFISMVARK